MSLLMPADLPNEDDACRNVYCSKVIANVSSFLSFHHQVEPRIEIINSQRDNNDTLEEIGECDRKAGDPRNIEN